MESLMSSFFCLISFLWDSFLLLQVAVVHSFSLLQNIPLYEYMIIHLASLLQMDIWVVSNFTHYIEYCWEHSLTAILMCTHSSSKYILRSKIAGHRAYISSNLPKAAKQVSKGVIWIYTTYCQVKKICYSGGYRVASYCSFFFIFCCWLMKLNSFLHVSWLFEFLLHCRVIFFICRSFLKKKMCFGFKSSVSYICYKHHFPFCDLFF